MNRPRVILVCVLTVLVMALLLGCDSETTGPKPAEHAHVDPIDWDGDKEDWVGGGSGQTVSDAPSVASTIPGFDARDHVLGSDLGAHDHTVIMEAILGNVGEIAARLPQSQASSEMDVLKAALAVPAIDRYTKSRIRLVLSWLARLQRVRDQIPDETRQAISDVLERLEACPTIADKTEALQQMIDSGQYGAYEGLPQGMAAGVAILRDGEKTVYAPRCLINFKRLVEHDVEGAIAGAIGGLIVAGPPGAGLGAVAGAAGASGSDLVGQLTGWW